MYKFLIQQCWEDSYSLKNYLTAHHFIQENPSQLSPFCDETVYLYFFQILLIKNQFNLMGKKIRFCSAPGTIIIHINHVPIAQVN